MFLIVPSRKSDWEIIGICYRASFKLGYKIVHILISEQESFLVLQILSFIDINGALA